MVTTGLSFTFVILILKVTVLLLLDGSFTVTMTTQSFCTVTVVGRIGVLRSTLVVRGKAALDADLAV